MAVITLCIYKKVVYSCDNQKLSLRLRSIFVTQKLAYAYEVVLSVTRVTIKNF